MAPDDAPPPRLAAMLLTGGRSRRMGRDKATIMIAGERLADRTAALLKAVADPVLEVGPGHTSLPCTREDPPGSGPLAALAAGAARLESIESLESPDAHATAALLIATDLPRLTTGLLRLLAGHPGTGCVVPLDAGGRPQVACARYSAEALALAPQLVAAGHRSLKALLDRVPVTWLPYQEWIGAAGRPDALSDIDTPADLDAVEPANDY